FNKRLSQDRFDIRSIPLLYCLKRCDTGFERLDGIFFEVLLRGLLIQGQIFVGGDEELEEIVGIGKHLDAGLYQVCCNGELLPVVILREVRVVGYVVAQAESEFLRLQQADVISIDSFKLLLIKARWVAQNILDVKVSDQITHREDIFISRKRPSQQREVVEHALWDDAIIAMVEQVRLWVALR